MNNSRNEPISNPQRLYLISSLSVDLYADGDRHTPTFSRRSSYENSIPDLACNTSPYRITLVSFLIRILYWRADTNRKRFNRFVFK